MRLSISNIAWDVAEDHAVAALLNSLGINTIDVAPGKYFPDPAAATAEDIRRVHGWWQERGIAIHGMQALLFGTKGLNVFGNAASQEAMLRHLDTMCRIGDGLGARRLVFGSPKNRDRNGLEDEVARDRAVVFFRRLGDIASRHDVVICLEPNPPCYGANFMTTSLETASVVERVAHPAVAMQLDTGTLAINGEDAAVIIKRCAPLIGHVHVSEPDLLTVGDIADGDNPKRGADHATAAAALRRHLPQSVVTVEMLASRHESHLDAIERALHVALAAYGDVKASE